MEKSEGKSGNCQKDAYIQEPAIGRLAVGRVTQLFYLETSLRFESSCFWDNKKFSPSP